MIRAFIRSRCLSCYCPLLLFAMAIVGFNSPKLDAQEEWGHLTGKIIVDGTIPAPDEITLTTDDRRYCIDTGEEFTDRSLMVGPDGGLQHAYVMMYFSRNDKKRPETHPSYLEEETVVTLDNKNCRFQPRALFLRTGQTIQFKNSDRIGHNCHIVTMGNEENCSLSAGQTIEMQLEESDKVPGMVKCDAHPWMKAVLLVRDEPYAAISGEDGSFRIENLPAGEWTFQFWHKRTGFMKTLQKDDATPLGRGARITVTIPAGGTYDLGELRISIDDLLEK